MYKEIMRSTEGMEIGAVISFLIFFGFFLMLIIYLISMRKEHRDEMKHIPLED